MKLVKNFYLFIIIIILTSTSEELESGADFTVDELKHVSDKLKPVECMRLIEAIYSVLPSENGHIKDLGSEIEIRETPVNMWISKDECLNELKSWSNQFPVHLDESEPKARVLMVLHLNAIGRSDIGNYLLKKHKKDKRFITIKKKFHRKDILRGISAIEKNRNPDQTVHQLARRSLVLKKSTEKLKNILLSKNFLLSVTVSFLIATIVCGFFLYVIRKRVKSLTCCEKRRNLHQSRNAVLTRERGLQCVDLTKDDQSTQISEIDVEGCSWDNKKFVETETQTLISDRGNETFRVSVEKLGILGEELGEKRTMDDVKFRKKKNKMKRKRKKVKEDTKSAREYLKVMKEKILSSKNKEERRSKRHSRNHWVCQCFNCKSFHEKKIDDSSKVKNDKKESAERGKKNKSKRVEKNKEISKIEDRVKNRGEINTERKILQKNFSRITKRVRPVSSSSSSLSSETEFQPNMK